MINNEEFEALVEEAQGKYYDDSNIYGLIGPIPRVFPEYHTYRHIVNISQYDKAEGASVIYKELIYDWDKHCVREEEFEIIVQDRQDFRSIFLAQIPAEEYKKALQAV